MGRQKKQLEITTKENNGMTLSQLFKLKNRTFEEFSNKFIYDLICLMAWDSGRSKPSPLAVMEIAIFLDVPMSNVDLAIMHAERLKNKKQPKQRAYTH